MAQDFDPALGETFAFAGARCNRSVRRVLAVLAAPAHALLKLSGGAERDLVRDGRCEFTEIPYGLSAGSGESR
jgi:hypothetical protein